MKSRFCGPVSRQPAFPWQPFCVPRIWGGGDRPDVSLQVSTWYTELLHF